ncbi:hypothetical protein ACFONC_05465 [Luteimonas soli]|uniref:Uncharacterized protein n=1 Tax=Luteimonas soli TaxID=1648966 RepID=A0ABV7XHQ4_9GAMM
MNLPALPDPAVFSNADHSVVTADGGALLTYDPATRAAFIYAIESRRWTIQAPIEFEMFVATAALAGYRLSDSPETKRWLECGNRSCRPVPTVVKH